VPWGDWRELIEAARKLLQIQKSNLYEKTFEVIKTDYPENVYGDGNTGERIVKIWEFTSK